jgi:hypothetical protein
MERRPRGRSLPADAMVLRERFLQVDPYRRVGAPCPAGRFCGITLLDVSTMKCQLHLSLFIHSRRHHEPSWRHKGSLPLALNRWLNGVSTPNKCSEAIPQFTRCTPGQHSGCLLDQRCISEATHVGKGTGKPPDIGNRCGPPRFCAPLDTLALGGHKCTTRTSSAERFLLWDQRHNQYGPGPPPDDLSPTHTRDP